MEVSVRTETWAFRYPFRITGYEFTDAEVVVAEVSDGGMRGRGEALGVYYKEETTARLSSQIIAAAQRAKTVTELTSITESLPGGGAKNALDCALWELRSQLEATPVWRLAGLTSAPQPVQTTATVGAGPPDEMSARARDFATATALKLKLIGDGGDAERVRAVRAARPDVWLGVDGNQGFTLRTLHELLPTLVASEVQLLEQPFPADRDADLDEVESPIPIAADESVQTLNDMEHLVGRFDTINIKLDKCGGLTEALRMQQRARELGLNVMVGCMGGTSLSMAPAFVVAQRCDVVDLDGPLLLVTDRTPSAIYRDGRIYCPEEVWGFSSSLAAHDLER